MLFILVLQNLKVESGKHAAYVCTDTSWPTQTLVMSSENMAVIALLHGGRSICIHFISRTCLTALRNMTE